MRKIFSLLVAISYITLAYLSGDGQLFLWVIFYSLLILACIWYGDAMGSYIGFGGGPRGYPFTYIDEKTPGSMIRLMGWILIFLPIIIMPVFLLLTAP